MNKEIPEIYEEKVEKQTAKIDNLKEGFDGSL